MKIWLNDIIAAAVFCILMMVSSCSFTNNHGEQDEASVRLEVDSVAADRAMVRILPAGRKSVYYFSMMRKSEFEKMDGWNEVICMDLLSLREKAAEGPSGIMDSVMFAEAGERIFDNLASDTEYIVYAFGLRDELLSLGQGDSLAFYGLAGNMARLGINEEIIGVPFVYESFMTGSNRFFRNKGSCEMKGPCSFKGLRFRPVNSFYDVVHSSR